MLSRILEHQVQAYTLPQSKFLWRKSSLCDLGCGVPIGIGTGFSFNEQLQHEI